MFIVYSIYFLFFYFILLYNTILVLPYINMNPPQVYMSSQSWTPLPPPSLYHLFGSSPCTSPKHPVSCIKQRLAIRFLHDSIHVSVPFSQFIPGPRIVDWISTKVSRLGETSQIRGTTWAEKRNLRSENLPNTFQN